MEAKTKAPDIASLRLFDSCVTLGRTVCPGVPESLTPDNILQVMDKYDIAEALVHDHEARMIRPRARGNRQLLETIKGMDRLHPVWILEPPESPDPREAYGMVQEMLDSGVKAARLMMGLAPPMLWLWDDLCTALEEHYVPCFLDFAPLRFSPGAGTTQGLPDSTAMEQLLDICLAHPDLPLILSHVSGGLGLAYPTVPLMRRMPNLHTDVTGVVNYWRRVAVSLGPQRVLFATGMPFYEPATFISNVQYAHEIDEEAKKRICGDNLRALLEAVE